jgi:hypothetical protein
MRVEIIQGGRVLRQYNHEGRSYVEAPPTGVYQIRLVNNSPHNRLGVVSVDGRNIIDGEVAGYTGGGYVVGPWQSVTIQGWRRDDAKAAQFEFTPQEASYAAAVGDGVKNTGIIGVAVFAEKPKPPPRRVVRKRIIEEYSYRDESFGGQTLGGVTRSWNADHDGGEPICSAVPCSASIQPESTKGVRKSRSRGVTDGRLGIDSLHEEREITDCDDGVELGTGFGNETDMFTVTTTFERASEAPMLVIQLQYAVREKLKAWGVPVHETPKSPSAFPASTGPSVAPPPGWRGNR